MTPFSIKFPYLSPKHLSKRHCLVTQIEELTEGPYKQIGLACSIIASQSRDGRPSDEQSSCVCLLLLSQCFLLSQRPVISPLPALMTDKGRCESQKQLVWNPGAWKQICLGARMWMNQRTTLGLKPLGPRSLGKQMR
jgi:hypothetical protein